MDKNNFILKKKDSSNQDFILKADSKGNGSIIFLIKCLCSFISCFFHFLIDHGAVICSVILDLVYFWGAYKLFNVVDFLDWGLSDLSSLPNEDHAEGFNWMVGFSFWLIWSIIVLVVKIVGILAFLYPFAHFIIKKRTIGMSIVYTFQTCVRSFIIFKRSLFSDKKNF